MSFLSKRSFFVINAASLNSLFALDVTEMLRVFFLTSRPNSNYQFGIVELLQSIQTRTPRRFLYGVRETVVPKREKCKKLMEKQKNPFVLFVCLLFELENVRVCSDHLGEENLFMSHSLLVNRSFPL